MTKGWGRHVERTMDTFEIIYVNSGTLGIFEEDVEYDVEKGEALILFPGRHHGGTRDFDEDLTFYWLHFTMEEEALRMGSDIMALPQLIRLAKPEAFEELFRRFIRRQNVCRDDKTFLNLVLLELLCELSDSPLSAGGQRDRRFIWPTRRPGISESTGKSRCPPHFSLISWNAARTIWAGSFTPCTAET